MRLCLYLLILFVVNTSIASDLSSDYGDNVETDALQGSWHLVAMEIHGRNEPRFPSDLIVTYKAGKFTAVHSDLSVAGTYKNDARSKPARLDDLHLDGPDQGKGWKYIYQIDGDTLKLAYKLGQDAERPKGFDEREKLGLVIDTYKRVK